MTINKINSIIKTQQIKMKISLIWWVKIQNKSNYLIYIGNFKGVVLRHLYIDK